VNFKRLGASFQQWLSVLVMAYVALVLYTNLPLFIGAVQLSNIAVVFYYALIPLAIVTALLNPSSAMAFVRTPLLVWSLVMLAMYGANLGRLMLGTDVPTEVEVQIDQIQRFMLLPIVGYLVFANDVRWLRMFVPVGVFVACSMIILDFNLPDLITNVGEESGTIRGTGLYFDPNTAAEAALLGCIVLQGLVRRTTLSLFVLLCGVAVAFTFSRSGLLFYAVMMIVMLLNGRLPKLFVIVPIAALLGFGSITALVERQASQTAQSDAATDKLLDRFAFFNRDVNSVLDDADEDGRSDLARTALNAALQRPFVGHGSEFRDPVNEQKPHNLLLQMWYVYGLTGVAGWLGLVWVLWRGGPEPNPLFRLGALAFAYFSFFSHNLLEYLHWFAALGMYLFASGSNARGRHGTGHSSTSGNRSRRRRRRRSTPLGSTGLA